jgi:hypothetical protein
VEEKALEVVADGVLDLVADYNAKLTQAATGHAEMLAAMKAALQAFQRLDDLLDHRDSLRQQIDLGDRIEDLADVVKRAEAGHG